MICITASLRPDGLGVRSSSSSSSDVRIAHVHRNVAAPLLLGTEQVHDLVGVVEGLGEYEPTPPTVERDVAPHVSDEVLGCFLPGTAPQRLAGVAGALAARIGHEVASAPGRWACNHISSRPSCHSRLPRNGVSAAFGSASSRST